MYQEGSLARAFPELIIPESRVNPVLCGQVIANAVLILLAECCVKYSALTNTRRYVGLWKSRDAGPSKTKALLVQARFGLVKRISRILGSGHLTLGGAFRAGCISAWSLLSKVTLR